jgi:hypothetical protein
LSGFKHLGIGVAQIKGRRGYFRMKNLVLPMGYGLKGEGVNA